jgi:hypothetical protein
MGHRRGCVGLGDDSQVQFCTDRVTVLLRICDKPHLTSLSGFQGPTTTHSVRQKKDTYKK